MELHKPNLIHWWTSKIYERLEKPAMASRYVVEHTQFTVTMKPNIRKKIWEIRCGIANDLRSTTKFSPQNGRSSSFARLISQDVLSKSESNKYEIDRTARKETNGKNEIFWHIL